MIILRIDDPVALKECVAQARRVVAAAEDGTLHTIRMWVRDADPRHGIGHPTLELKVNGGMWTSPISATKESHG